MQPETELASLNSIISRDIPNIIQLECPVTRELMEDFRMALTEESDRIKTSIVLWIGQAGKKKHVRKYIRQQQQSLIALNSQLTSNVLPEQLVMPVKALDSTALCYYAYKTLEELLTFMEINFTSYFDSDAWLPLNYRLLAIQEIRQDIEQLENLLVNAKVDYKLLTVIFLEFWQFISQDVDTQLTWRKARYLKTLKAELFRLFENSNDGQDMTESIRFLLISLNFNVASFLAYYTNFIVTEFNAVSEPSLRYEKLSFCMKQINQVRDKPGLTLDTRYRPIKEQIAVWIAEELNFHQSTQLTLDLGTVEKRNDQLAKIEFDMSVAQVSCLLFGFVENNVIKNSNLLEVFRTVSAMIKTKRAEKLSSESLRVRYYNIEYTAKVAVIERLRAIANFLEKANV